MTEVSGECMLLGFVSSQQRFGVTDIKAPPPHQRVTALGFWTDRVIALRSQTDHVIALK